MILSEKSATFRDHALATWSSVLSSASERGGRTPMPTFDIVSKTDLPEVDNALANMVREMSQRYDFKGSQSKIERKEAEITINADDELKLKQMHELLQGHLARRQ